MINAIVVLHFSIVTYSSAAKVYKIPETGTPLIKGMFTLSALNPLTGEIFVFGGKNDEKPTIKQFAAYNTRNNTWRHIVVGSDTKPSDS
mmetsp:Transcript_27110/g.48645  ORF Transcript_27110/g.48645 Transcript_27110/m.48645 type:complete len:89 (-) Transcript_27110:930-1196(-)